MTTLAIENWGALVANGTDAFFHNEIDSTNSEALRIAPSRAGASAWIVAARQSGGRGRRGRVWSSLEGNLFTSFLFFYQGAPESLSGLPFATALAVRDTCIRLGVNPQSLKCKWPNDVLIEARKTAGILIESTGMPKNTADSQQVIIGIGLNVQQAPDNAHYPATSIRAETGNSVSLKDSFSALAHALHQRLQEWQFEGTPHIVAEWNQHAWGLGSKRLIRTNSEEFTATLLSLTSDGGLKVRLDDGTEKRLYAADIFDAPPTAKQ